MFKIFMLDVPKSRKGAVQFKDGQYEWEWLALGSFHQRLPTVKMGKLSFNHIEHCSFPDNMT